MMIHPNLVDQLDMFVMAADLGTFSATARKMGRAQNVVSYGISTLETSLNIRLFDRSGHKAVLTPGGRALLRQARNIVTSAHDLSRSAEELAAGVETVLTVAVDDMIPLDYFEAALIGVAEHYPGLELRLNRTAGHEARILVRDAQAALGICANAFDMHPDQPFTLINQLEMTPVISPALHDATHQDKHQKSLAGRDKLISQVSPGLRQIVLSGAESPDANPDQGVLSSHIWRVPDIKSKYDLIQRGFGWGMLPTHLVEGDLETGKLLPLRLRFVKALPTLPVFIFSQIDTALGPAARLFRDEIIAAGEDNPININS
jgi:DNA-binding transcriptional LysR family regulator